MLHKRFSRPPAPDSVKSRLASKNLPVCKSLDLHGQYIYSVICERRFRNYFLYKIYKYVADVVNLGFTNTGTEDSISTYPIDVLKDLSEPQVRLRVETNMIRSYNISLTFSPMHYADGSSPVFYWKYKARIGNTPIDVEDVVFTSGDSVTRVFPGDYGNDDKVFICTYLLSYRL